jgi:single-strand DNA-binding protein
MLGYSEIEIIGNLGQTPEMRYLPSGDPVVNFSVAVSRRYKDRQGTQKEETDWYRIVAFNGLGTACAEFLKKGDACFVKGRLQIRTYDSKDGEQTSVEIIPTVVRFCGSACTAAEEHPRPGQPRSARKSTDPESDAAINNDDVPF